MGRVLAGILGVETMHEHGCGARTGSLVAWQCICEDDGAVYKDEAKLNMHRRISISNTIQKYRLISQFIGMKSVKFYNVYLTSIKEDN
jgi:hypothetical protein